MANEQITAAQFKKMVFLYTVGTSVILVSSTLASDAKNDAWIAAIVGTAGGLVLALFYLALARLVPGKTLVEICFALLGKWLGMICALLMFLYAFILTTLVMRNLGDFLTASMFPETPIYAIHLVYLIVVLVGIRYGLSNIARTMDIFYPFICLLLLLFAIMLLKDVDLKQLQPVFGNGAWPIVNATYSYISFPYMEYVLFLMIFPRVDNRREGGKAFLKGTLLGGFILFMITILCLTVIGSEMTANNLYASFEMAKTIKIGNFIQRFEAIIAAVWFVTIFCKLLLCFYMMIHSFAQTFQLGEYRPFVFPMGLVLSAISIIIVPDMGYFISFDRYVWTVYSVILGFIIPLLLLLVALIRGNGKTTAS